MAAAIDASSPAVVISATAAAFATASFTPPANSILIAVASTGNNTGSGVQSGTISDSLSGAWTSIITANTTAFGMAQILRRDVGGSPAAMTVTWTPSGTNGKGNQLKVFVVTGCGSSASAAVGATASSLVATTGALSITPTATGSLLLMGLMYSTTNVVLTVNASTTSDLATSDATNGETYAVCHLTGTTTTTTATSVGYTNTGLASVQQVAVEIKATGGAPPALTPALMGHRQPARDQRVSHQRGRGRF